MTPDILPPLYIQIKNFLIDKIKNREYDEYSKLPSERELSEKFNVSRMTARRGLKEVVDEGYAFRDGARGTFVVGKKVERNFVKLGGFSSHLRDAGISNISTRVIANDIIEADSTLSKKLNVLIGTKCYKFIRLRLGNDQPISVEYSYLSTEKFPGLLDFDFNKLSLYGVIEENYKYNLKSSKSRLEMEYFDEYNSELLNVDEGTPGFVIESIVWDDKENIIEYCKSFNRGDLYSFVYELRK